MTNIELPLEGYTDIETTQMIAKRRARAVSDDDILRSVRVKCRDNARTPMQWTDEDNAGFTTGKPWFPVNPNYREINASEQVGRAASVFSCYQALIRLRKESRALIDGTFTLLLPEHERIFAYTRSTPEEAILTVCNFYGDTIPNPLAALEGKGDLLISNYPDVSDALRPYEARIYRLAPENVSAFT